MLIIAPPLGRGLKSTCNGEVKKSVHLNDGERGYVGEAIIRCPNFRLKFTRLIKNNNLSIFAS